jgi:hypothetical protein
MLNKANIAHVRDLILDAPQHFNMSYLVYNPRGRYDATLENLHTCNTTACIAGWAAYAAGYRGNDSEEIEVIAADYLGLNHEPTPVVIGGQAGQLFYPPVFDAAPIGDRDSSGYYQATPEQAAVVLNHLIETGEVKWDVIKPSLSSSQD